jgi:hypothetical protein
MALQANISIFERFGKPSIIAALVLIVTLVRFLPWRSPVMMGDDIYNFLQFARGGSFLQVIHDAFLGTYAERYRPIFSLAWAFWTKLLGKDQVFYFGVLVALHCFNAWLFFSCAIRLSKNNWLVAAVLTIALAGSRFALFEVVMMTGLVEELAFIFFMAMLLSVIELYRRPSDRLRCFATFALLLCVFTHERYLAAVPWLSAAIWFSYNSDDKKRYVFTSFPLIILAANFTIKTLLLKTPFFVGTGGSYLELNFGLILTQAIEGLSSLFGFNRGPEYLTGRQIFIEAPRHAVGDIQVWSLAALFTVSWIASVFIGALQPRNGKEFAIPISLLVLAGMLLVPPLLSIRLEQRWLFAPLSLLLLTFAWASGVSIGNTKISAAVVTASLSLFAIDTILSASFGVNFVGYTERLGQYVGRMLLTQNLGRPGTPLILMGNANVCDTMGKGEIFKIYEGVARDLTCVPDKTRLKETAKLYPHSRAFWFSKGNGFISLNDELKREGSINLASPELAFATSDIKVGAGFNSSRPFVGEMKDISITMGNSPHLDDPNNKTYHFDNYISSQDHPIAVGRLEEQHNAYFRLKLKFRADSGTGYPNLFQTAPGNGGIRIEISGTVISMVVADLSQPDHYRVVSFQTPLDLGNWYLLDIEAQSGAFVRAKLQRASDP